MIGSYDDRMAERDCGQCGKPVIVGHHMVSGATTNDDGALELDVDLRHYDCLPIALRNEDPFIAGAIAAAESGIRDDALQTHLEGVMANGS